MTDENGGALSGPKPPNKDQRTTTNDDQISQNSKNAVRPSSATIEHREDETENARAERHRSAERSYWAFEKVIGVLVFLLTAGAVWGAIASAIYASRALSASQDAAKSVRDAVKEASLDFHGA